MANVMSYKGNKKDLSKAKFAVGAGKVAQGVARGVGALGGPVTATVLPRTGAVQKAVTKGVAKLLTSRKSGAEKPMDKFSARPFMKK